MSNEQIFWLFGTAFGLWLAVHCPQAAVREFRAGSARGLDAGASRERSYDRERQPFGFWLTVILTFLAGLMGVIFVAMGIAVMWGSVT